MGESVPTHIVEVEYKDGRSTYERGSKGHCLKVFHNLRKQMGVEFVIVGEMSTFNILGKFCGVCRCLNYCMCPSKRV